MNRVGGDISLLEEAKRSSRITHWEHLCLQFGLPERVKLLKTAGINLHLETFKFKHTDSYEQKGYVCFSTFALNFANSSSFDHVWTKSAEMTLYLQHKAPNKEKSCKHSPFYPITSPKHHVNNDKC